jgi:transcriptional coactivator HFI1/ADA1
MPDIDPAALSRPSNLTVTPSKTLSASAAAASQNSASKPTKSQQIAPRIDLEPIYTALKSALGEFWAEYKESVSLFVLGQLNQQELLDKIGLFIVGDSQKEHLHNQLINAIYGNAFRELPDQPVASWVAANDKPASLAKPASGDAAEMRLKTEVMGLPARDRRRLKEAGARVDKDEQGPNELNKYYNSKQIKIPELTNDGDLGQTSKYVQFNTVLSTNFVTDWEPEIRKRYEQPLASEINEFPDEEMINDRMKPICYEEGIARGAEASVAAFVSLATEVYIKQSLTNIFSRVRTNAQDYVQSRKYKKQLRREERLLEEEVISRNQATLLLPIEQETLESRPPLTMADMRMAFTAGDCYFSAIPLSYGKIMNSTVGLEDAAELVASIPSKPPEDDFSMSIEDEAPIDADGDVDMTNGHFDSHDPNGEMTAWGWQGGRSNDQKLLADVLDDCLAFG